MGFLSRLFGGSKPGDGAGGGRGGAAGRTLDELARRVGMTAGELRAVRVQYTAFKVPKKDGAARTIEAPSADLKRVQRRILRRVLGRLRAHKCVMGFERGLSFVDHARYHAGAAVIVRMDLKDFFPSTTQDQVERYLKVIGWGKDAAAEVVRLCCKDGRLPQGAPTSPRLANLVNVEMDARLEAAGRHWGAAYSRYADDIVFSFRAEHANGARGLITLARLIIKESGYRMNRKKGPRVLRGQQRQVVTGLVVNDGTPRLPRETRRWLRAVEQRAAKRLEGAKAATLTAGQIAGWRALVSMVERAKG